MTKLTFRLGERKPVAEATMSFRLNLAGQTFSFQPGQFVRVGLSDPPYPDPKGNVRSFSIASAPADPFVLIAIRMMGSAFKRSWPESPSVRRSVSAVRRGTLCSIQIRTRRLGHAALAGTRVLQTLASVVAAANAMDKSISICGEMAGNPAYTQLLLGLGFRSLSVSPGEILEIKNEIRPASTQQAELMAGRILEMATIQEIKDCLLAHTARK